MTIAPEDIRLMASQHMSDFPESGGRMSAVEIPDGAINAVFHGVDQVASISGRVLLRKVWPSVQTLDRSAFLNAHAILTDPPSDSNLGVLMFAAPGAADLRADAAERVESYAARSLALSVKPLDDQYAGGTALLVPKGGDYRWEEGAILYIGLEWAETDVVGLEKVHEYVRISEVVDDGAHWTLRLTGPLQHTYPAQYSYTRPGTNPPEIVTIYPTVLRQTTTDVAETRYYGVTAISSGAVSVGDKTLQATTPRQSILPAVSGPKILTDQDPIGHAPLKNRQAPQLVARQVSVVVPNPASQTVTLSGVSTFDVSTISVTYKSAGTVYRIKGGVSNTAGAITYSATLSQVVASLAHLPDVGSRVICTYADSADYRWTTNASTIRLDRNNSDTILGGQKVPGTVYYMSPSATYYDDGAGIIYQQDSNGITAVGTVTYDGGDYSITGDPIPVGTDGVAVDEEGAGASLTSAWAYIDPDIIPETLVVRAEQTDGTPISATTDVAGTITGTGFTSGSYSAGLLSLTFDNPVKPDTIRFDAQATKLDPAPKEQIGIDPLRLPADGQVDLFARHDILVIHSTQDTTLPQPLNAGTTHSTGRTNLAWIRLYDTDDTALALNLYTVDLAAGTVTMANPLDLSGYTQPIVARHRLEGHARVRQVDGDGTVHLYQSPRWKGAEIALPADSQVSNALLYGDLQSRVPVLFDQQSWGDAWSDSVIGNPADASYNDAIYPVEVTNTGAITERWVLEIDSVTNNVAHFKIIGETVGQIGDGYTSTDSAPVNPVTSQPYFTLHWEGWGIGWVPGNALRFNTVASAAPTWLALIQQPGALPNAGSCRIEFRGDSA